MRTRLLFIGMILWSVMMLGQSEKNNKYFKLNKRTKAKFIEMMFGYEDELNFKKINDSIYVGENVIYKIEKINGTKVRFYALNYKGDNQKRDSKKVDEEDTKKANAKKVDEEINYPLYYNNKLFEMTLKDYDSNKINFEYPDKIVIGALVLPFKYRPQDNESFETQFNLNGALGVLITPGSWSNFKLYLQGGAGIGSLILNSTIAKGVDADNTQNVTTFSGFSGLMLEYKKVQAGIYFGADIINNNKKFDWESQGKPWLSLGIGFKIFTLSSNNATKNDSP